MRRYTIKDVRIRFEHLCDLLGMKESVFVRESNTKCHMTPGLILDVSSPGDGMTRYCVHVHDGRGTGVRSQLLHSLGAKEFCEKAMAVGEAMRLAHEVSQAKVSS